MPLNVAVIGCGGFARGNHIPHVAQNQHLRLRALCDLREDVLRDLGAQYPEAYCTHDMERVFADEMVDLVVCATKPDARIPIMQRAVTARKHLFVEKPMCYSEEDARRMVSMLRDAPICFMVGFNRPYSPLMQALKPMYREHKKGSATIIYRIVGEEQLWPKHHWDAVMIRRESTVIHEVTHIFDLLGWLTESEPQSITMAGEGNTDNVIMLSYPNQVTAVIVAADNGTLGFPKERIEINTNYATITGDNFVELRAVNLGGQSVVRRFPFTRSGELLETSGEEAAELMWQWRRTVTEKEASFGYYYERRPKVDKGHAQELEAFRRAILEGRTLAATANQGVRAGALATILAWRALESWERGTSVRLNFFSLR